MNIINKYKRVYAGVFLSMSAFLAGEYAAWTAYRCVIDYPFKPLFVFFALPSILLLAVNMVMIKNNVRRLWQCINNLICILTGMALPVMVCLTFELTLNETSQPMPVDVNGMAKIFHIALIGIGVLMTVRDNIDLNITLIKEMNSRSKGI